MSGLTHDPDMDFFDELNEGGNLASTFYAAVGIVATLVIIIIILIIGYCYFTRYLVMRNRLMNRKVKLLTSPPQDDDTIELEVKNTTKTGSVDHKGEEDNAKEQQKKQPQSQEDEVAEPRGKDTDTTPLINETDGKVPNQNKTMDTEQVKNIPEGLYASVNKNTKTGNGVAQDVTVTADVVPITSSTGHGITVSDEDYAEVKCEHNTAYTCQPEIRTKDRSRTLPCTVDINLENEDYSRLVHDTHQPNPRHSMPLLSDYSQIGMGGAKWHSLEMELDQNENEDLYATPHSQNGSDDDNKKDTHHNVDTPSPLPTPVMDDPEKVLGLSRESRPSSQKQAKELDDEMMTTSDTPKGDSPPPLPPPYLDGELEEASEALYDQAMNHYQNLSSCIESGDGKIIGVDGKGALNSKDVDIVEEGGGTVNLEEGIYDSIDQEAD